MQEAAGRCRRRRRRQHRVGGQHRRQRRKPPVRPLDRQMKSGRIPACWCANRLPVRPKPTAISSATRCTSNRIAQRPREAQVLGVVHGHAGGALHQRLDQRRRAGVAALRAGLQRPGAGAGMVDRDSPAGAPARASGLGTVADRRTSGPRPAKERNVGHRQSAHRLAVITVRQADEAPTSSGRPRLRQQCALIFSAISTADAPSDA